MNLILVLLRLSLTNPTEAGQVLVDLRLNLSTAFSAFALVIIGAVLLMFTLIRLSGRHGPAGRCAAFSMVFDCDHGGRHFGARVLYLADLSSFQSNRAVCRWDIGICLDPGAANIAAHCANGFGGDFCDHRRDCWPIRDSFDVLDLIWFDQCLA